MATDGEVVREAMDFLMTIAESQKAMVEVLKDIEMRLRSIDASLAKLESDVENIESDVDSMGLNFD